MDRISMKDETGELFANAMREAFREVMSGGSFMKSLSGTISEGMMSMFGQVFKGMPFAQGEGGGGGDIFSMLGGNMSFFGGGLGGVVGGIGMLASVASMFKKDGKRAGQSGVDPIFDSTVVRAQGLDMLYGSDVFERAVFSSRNAGGDMLRGFAGARMNPQMTVHIKPSREFDAIADEKWVRSSTLNEMAGIPRRTNFNHG